METKEFLKQKQETEDFVKQMRNLNDDAANSPPPSKADNPSNEVLKNGSKQKTETENTKHTGSILASAGYYG